MKIYWTLASIPEFSNMTRYERHRALRRMHINIFRYWQTWFGLLACGICAGVGSVIGNTLGHSIIGGVVGASVGGFVFSQTVLHVRLRHYRDVMSRGEVL